MSMRSMPKLPILAALTALSLGLAACGSSSSSSSATSAAGATSASSGTGTGTGTSTSASSGTGTSGGAAAGAGGAQAIAANPSGQLAYTKKTLTANAGTVKIAFTNKSPLGHNLTIQKGTNGAVVGATPTFDGGTKVLSVKLAPGTYTFFCSVPGHRMAGMVGTLTVK
jgi:plastocyanin